MPPGRFVFGVTQTSLGGVAVIGICIPWFGSRTEARRKLERRVPWEDHEQYLAGLAEVLGRAGVCEASDRDGGLQSNHGTRRPCTS